MDDHSRGRRFHVRAPRRLRSWRRHPLSVHSRRRLTVADDGLRSARMGRQRDMAGARGCGIAVCVSDGVRDHHSGAVFPDPPDAARPYLSRRRIRVSPQGNAASPAMERGVLRGLHRRDFLSGRRARRVRSGLRRDGPDVRWDEPRLDRAVSARDRRWPAVRVRAARRHVARHEDGG